MGSHNKEVASIAQAVKGLHSRGEPFRVFHGSTNSTRPRPHSSQPTVDISALSNVLHVDQEARIALVEPNVPMDKLVEATLAHSLVPPVVMEFPGITAGGGFAGTSGESSSFRHGFFDSIVEEVEMVLGNGDIITASRNNEHADLFRGAAGAVGSLGLTTLLKIRLMPAKKYVALTYHRTSSVADAVARIRAETEDAENEYVDGILYSKDHGAIITGRLTDEKPDKTPVQTFSRARDPWFFQHVREKTRQTSPSSPSSPTGSSITDYIPLAEYLFRYDRAGFWVGAGGFDYFKLIPLNSLTRWIFDDLLHTRMLYRALHAGGLSSTFFVQDIAFPYDKAEQFIDYAAEEMGIWPLWLCPLKPAVMPTFHPVAADPDAPVPAADENGSIMSRPMLNIGIWGWGPKSQAEFVRKNRAMEDKTVELGGRKWLYAHTYYPENQFWKIYDPPASGTINATTTTTTTTGDSNKTSSSRDSQDASYEHSWYHALREKYHAEGLPSAWEKVRVSPDTEKNAQAGWKGVWPLGGTYGVLKSMVSGDHKLHRQAQWKYAGTR